MGNEQSFGTRRLPLQPIFPERLDPRIEKTLRWMWEEQARYINSIAAEVEFHDNNFTGNFGEVGGNRLIDQSITTAKLANLAVTLAKLANGSVDITKTASSIRPAELFDVMPAPGHQGRLVLMTATDGIYTVNTLYRDTGTEWTAAVATADLSGQIVNDQIAANAVEAIQLAPDAVVFGKIAANAVGANQLAANSVIAGKVAANAIGANELSASSVVAGKIAANAVGANELTANSVIAGKVAAGAIGATEIAANAITVKKLAVVPEGLQPDPAMQDESWWNRDQGWAFLTSDGSNLAHQMGVPKCLVQTGTSLTYSYCGTPEIPFAGVGQTTRMRYKAYNNSNQTMYLGVSYKNTAGGDISYSLATVAGAAGHVTGNVHTVVPAGTVKIQFWCRTNGAGFSGTMAIAEWKLDIAATADLIVDGAITTNKLYAGSVTSDKITVANLSVIKTDIGSITAGTITGALFQTEATANRGLKFDSAGLRAYNSTGVQTVNISNNGTATFAGIVTALAGSTMSYLIPPPDGSNGSNNNAVYGYHLRLLGLNNANSWYLANLQPWVPAGYKMVLIRIYASGTVAGLLHLNPFGVYDKRLSGKYVNPGGAAGYWYYDALVPLDANRHIAYQAFCGSNNNAVWALTLAAAWG